MIYLCSYIIYIIRVFIARNAKNDHKVFFFSIYNLLFLITVQIILQIILLLAFYGHRNKNNVPWNIPIDPVGLTVVIQKVSLLTNWTPYCSTTKIPKQPDYGISRNSNPNPSYRVTLYLSLFLCWYTSSNFERNCLLIELHTVEWWIVLLVFASYFLGIIFYFYDSLLITR